MIILVKRFTSAIFGLALLCTAMQQQAMASQIIDLDAGPDNWNTLSGGVVTSRTGTNLPQGPSMWACAQADAANCENASFGPDQAVFSNLFFLSSNVNVGGAFNILADDLLIVSFNGTFTFAAALDENQDSSNNPVPLEFGILGTDLILQSGNLISQGSFNDILLLGQNNGMVINAFDGHFKGSEPAGTTCSSVQNIPNSSRQWCVTDRGQSYVFVDGAIVAVSEPTTLTLLAIGTLGLLLRRKG